MDTLLGVVRIFVGGLMLMTGIMKLVVPNLRRAFEGQLRLARLPCSGLTFRLLPIAEVFVGTLLVFGVLTRLDAVVVLVMMLGAGYVHVVVHDPSVFPLQPNAPIIPAIVGVMAVVLLIGGTGSWGAG